ncbi:MAG: cysteine--tRNA ligase, partial [Actinomycetota bacterium]
TDLAERAAGWYQEDIEAFGIGMPDRMPKVTETMSEIIDFVTALIDAGTAYEAGGDVYFRVSEFEDYGVLSRQYGALQETEEPNSLKENPLDFALWKATKDSEDASWDSPWGPGRPGWHIECSAMARRELGDAFAIHGGGLDLCFPHHENELAQSESLGLGFAKVWAHNGMLEFTGEKMSKSIGNLETIEDAHNNWGRSTLLMLFVSVHWRRSMDYSETTLKQAASRLRSLRRALTQTPEAHDESQWAEFAACLDDNFDTAKALVVLHRWADTGQVELLRRGLELFGLLDTDGADDAASEIPEDIHAMAVSRSAAKAERDFARADQLRDELLDLGW